jgi:hypothetical protein
MYFPESRAIILIGMLIGSALARAEPPDKASSPSNGPSTEILKQARLAGYRVRKLRQGVAIFCKNDAHVGTRFSTESCIDESQLEEFLLWAQAQRDEIRTRKGTSTNLK